jgi:general secretion pathway protein J
MKIPAAGHRMTRLGRPNGFTLLELLISIAMVGLIVLIVTGAVTVSRRSIGSGERKIEEMERVRTTISIMDAQVQSGLPLTRDEDGAIKNYFEGQRDALKLATSHSVWKGQGGYVEVTYSIGADTDGKKTLSAAEQTVGLEDTQGIELLRGFDDISFSYYAKDPLEAEGKWIEEWTDETRLPEKVMLSLKKGDRSQNIVMPLRVRGPEDWTEFQTTAQKTQ